MHSHQLAGHPGRDKTLEMVTRNYYFLGMRKLVHQYVAKCESCQRHKGKVEKPAILHQYPRDIDPWDYTSMDFMGPLATTDKENRYLLVFVDYLSRFVELVPTSTKSAVTVAEALRERVITRHSTPKVLISDNAKEFCGEVMQNLCNFYNIKKVATVAYHPQANGLVERANRKIIDCLKHVLSPTDGCWDEVIPDVQVALNATVNSSTGETPHYILHGYDKRLPTFLMEECQEIPPIYNWDDYISVRTVRTREIFQQVRHSLLEITVKRNKSADEKAVMPGAQVGQKCFLKNPVKQGPLYKVSPKFVGPYHVVEDVGKGKFKLKCMRTSVECVAHWNRIKLIVGDVDPFFMH